MTGRENEITKEEIKKHMLNEKNIEHLSTENGFSLAVGYDQHSLPTNVFYGNETDMMDQILKEMVIDSKKIHKIKEFLVKRIYEVEHRINSWNDFTQSGNFVFQILSLRLDTYKEILSEITGEMI